MIEVLEQLLLNALILMTIIAIAGTLLLGVGFIVDKAIKLIQYIRSMNL